MKKTTLKILAVALLSCLLPACGSGGGGGGNDGGSPAQAVSATPEAAPQPARESTSYPLAPAGGYQVTVLGLRGESSIAVALNDTGIVVGNYFEGPGQARAYRWRDGTLETVIDDGQATAINNLGIITGWRTTPAGEEGVRLSPAADGHLVPMGAGSRAYHLNNLGEVVGLAESVTGQVPFWTDSTGPVTLAEDVDGYANLISDSGLVIVHVNVGDSVVPAVLTPEGVDFLPTYGGQFTFTRDVNLQGDIVGWAMDEGGEYRAVAWTAEGVLVDLTPPGESHCAAVGINDFGTVVIKCQNEAGDQGFVLDAGGALAELSFPGVTGVVPNAINNRGQIAGWLTTAEGERRSFLATPQAE